MISYVILVLLTFTGVAHTQRIVIPPEDATGISGESTKFHCNVKFGPVHALAWEFNNNIIYSIEGSIEKYHAGTKKYQVTHEGTHFTLWINNLHMTDGGIYTCTSMIASASAVLLVLGTPNISTSSPYLMEGVEVEYVCQAQFAGPSNSKKFPQLKMFFDGAELILPTQEQHLEGPNNWYQLTQTHAIVPDASTDSEKIICVLGTVNPAVHVNVTIEFDILYWVHDVSYTPIKKQYKVGSLINCTADGRPEPHFKWQDNENKGNLVKGPSLEIKQAMLGSNSWACIAGNTIGGKLYEKSVRVDFQAVDPGKGFHDEKSTGSDNDSWKIGVGVGAPVVICLVGIIGTLLYCRAKREHKNGSPIGEEDETEQDSKKSMNDDNQNMQPLLSENTMDKKHTKKAQIVKYQTSNPKLSEESVKIITERKEEQHTTSMQDDTVQHDSNSSYKLPSVASMRESFQGLSSSDANLKGKLSSFQANNNDRDDVLGSQEEIAKEDCFHGILPIELRYILLRKDGDFLITKGSTGKDFELSFSLGGKIEISPLKYRQGKWRLDERNDYDSIQNLVSSLSGQQSFLAGKTVLLKRVVELQEWELTDTNDVVLDRGLPDSKFGEVSGGTFKGEKVAVKILKQAASENEWQTSFNDIYFLMHYNHKNIARFMGITVSKQPLITVMEPQCKGGLLNFLYQHKKKLRSRHLLKMCKDVADGVEYLRANNIIHRDLAARNCLVGKDDTVKICNFFMARKVKEGEEYQADKSEPVQVRWAAPEILEHRKYSTHSDIWSLGVLMWEIYSYGETPYEGVAENDILYHVTMGKKLAIPDGTPNEIFQLMQECWMVEEKKRPKMHAMPGKIQNVSKKYW